MAQPELTKFARQLLVNTNTVDVPIDSPSSAPQFVLSPRDSTGTGTLSLLFMYNIPAASQAIGPFVFTPYLRDPVTGLWGACTATTALAARSLYSFEFDAAEITIRPTPNGTDGDIILMLSEQ